MTDKLELARDKDGFYGLYNGEIHRGTFGDWGPMHKMWWGIGSNRFRRVFGRHLLRRGRKAEVESITIKLKGKK